MAIDQTVDAVQANAQYLDQGAAMVSVAQQIEQAVAGQLAVFGSMQQAVSDLSGAMQGLPGQLGSVFSALQSGNESGFNFLETSNQVIGSLGDLRGAAELVQSARPFAAVAAGYALVAAGVAGLTIAYVEGGKESEAYLKALTLTGNEVGTTVGQMHAMAASIDGVVGTHGKAAESLAIFASQSATGATNLERYTQVAIGFERAAGQAVSETAQQFASLQDAPLNAVQKLNNGMNFLTEATYAQIKSLEEQGMVTEAADVAQAAFADALTQRSKAMEENLGLVERGWRGIKDAVSEAWDSVKSIGRNVGVEGQYAAQQQVVEKLQADLDSRRAHGLNTTYLESHLNAATDRLADLNNQVALNQINAQLEAERATRVKARVEADKDGLKYLSAAERVQRQINAETEKIRRSYEGLTDEKSQKKMEAEIAAREKAIRESAAKPRSVHPSYGMGKELSEYDKVMKHLNEVPVKAAAAEAAQAGYTKSQAELKALMESPAWEKFTEKQRENIRVKYEAKILGEQEVELATRRAKADADAAQSREKYITSLSGGIDKIQADIVAQEEANARMGMSKEAIAALEIAKIEMMAVDLELQAIKVMDKNLDEAAYELLMRQAQGYRTLAQAKKDGAAKETALASEAQAKGAQKNSTEKPEDGAKKAQDEAKATADAITKGLTDAITTAIADGGKAGGKKLRDTLQEQLLNKPLKLWLEGGVKSLLGGAADFLGGLLGIGGKGSGGANSGGGTDLLSSLLGSLGGSGGKGGSSSTSGPTNSVLGVFGSKLNNSVKSFFGMGSGAPVTLADGSLSKAALDGTNAFGNNSVANAFDLKSAAGSAAGAAMGAIPWVQLIYTGMKMAGQAFDEGYRLTDKGYAKAWLATGGIGPITLQADTKLLQKFGLDERSANIITAASLWAKFAEGTGLQATPHTGAGAIYQNGVTTGGREIYNHGTFGFGDSREYAATAQETVSKVASDLGKTLDGFFGIFGLKTGYKVSTAFADDRSKDGAWGALRIEDVLGKKVLDWADTKNNRWAPKEFKDGEEGFKQYMDAVADSTIEAFKASAGQMPAWANRIVAAANTAGDDTAKVLEQVLTDVAAFPNAMLQSAGTSRDALVEQFAQGLMTGDAEAAGQSVADTLMTSVEKALVTNAAGQIFDIVNVGIVTPMLDALITGASLSEILSQESIDRVIAAATQKAAALNSLFNDPRFAALLEQLRTGLGSALGAAGSSFNYEPRYGAVAAPAGAATGEQSPSSDESPNAYDSALKSLSIEREDLNVELLRAQGRNAEADELAKDLDKSRYMEAFEALDDVRRMEIATLYDANTATRLVIDVQKERNGLQDELNALTDDATQALSRQRDALDESNRALFDQVQAIKLQKTIADELPGVVDKYLSPAQRRQSQYDQVTADLNAVGIKVSAEQLMGLSRAQIGSAAMDIYNTAGVSDEARLAVVRAAGALADLKNADVDTAFAALERAVDAQRKVLDEAITELTSVFETARDAAKTLFGEVESAVQFQGDEGRAFISNALAVAQSTGYLPESKEFSKAVSDATGALGQQMFATQAESDYQRLVLANELKGLQDISGDQLEKAKDELEYLDEQLAEQRKQIDVLNGIDLSVQSVAGAINALGTAMNGARSATTLGGSGLAAYDKELGVGRNAAGTLFQRDDIRQAAGNALEAGANPRDIYNVIKGSGFTLAQAGVILGTEPGSLENFAREMDWPVFHRGTRRVPRTGFALLQQGEAVIPAAYNPFTAGRGWSNSNDMLAAMEGVRAELIEVRRQNDALQRAAMRTADAVNGRPEAPMLVENV